MALKPYAVVDTTPREVVNEDLKPLPGETVYKLDLDDQTIELLAKGIVPEDLARVAFEMLVWKRMNARSEARKRA